MITSNYITHYLPAAIIALLLVVVAMLVWMLQQAVRKQRGLEVEIEQMQTKIQHEENKDTGSKEEEARLNVTDEAQPDEMPDNVFVIHIDQLIARNIGKNDFTASTIAQVMHLSRSQLDRRMKQLAGKTATAYLLDRRMTYARELLLTTKMPVADVATACGFEDTSYFTRVFKQHYGNTPSGMRG